MNIPWNLYYFPAAEVQSLGMVLAEHGARIGSTLSERALRTYNERCLQLSDQDNE